MRSIWQILMFMTIATAVWTLFHVYMYRRLIRPLRIRSLGKRAAAMSVFAVLAVVGPLVMASGRLVEIDGWLWSLRWVGYVLMGASFVLFSFTLFRDIAWWLARLTDRSVGAWRRRTVADATGVLPASPERRAFLFNATSAGVLAVGGTASAVGVATARRDPPIKPVDVPVDDLHPDLDGLTIAHLSDVHVGPTISSEDFAKMVAAVNAETPDIVVITGDLVDGTVEHMRDDLAPLSDIESRYGVFYCTGNHEYYWDGPAWCEEVASHGIRVLVNEHDVLQIGEAKLLVGGVTDIRAGKRAPGHATDPMKAIAGAPDDVDYKIALAHQPGSIYGVAEAGFDLQLSGHTHGGQFFPVMLFVGLVHEFVAGLDRHRDTQIFVTTGAGYWGPPQRLGVPSELPLLTLRRA